ncbi:MAG: hypothetical protein K6B46_03655 [Opitutales bacterium]|nr:hypothetical protein [Opitutales bacterium]
MSLFSKKTTSIAKKAKDWHSEIDQKAKSSLVSRAARIKRWVLRLKGVAIALSAAFLVFIFTNLFVKIASSDEVNKAYHINDVVFHSDGALDKDWFLKYTGFYSSMVMTRSVYDVQKQLLDYPQILRAEVERDEKNHLLTVRVQERRAFARVKLADGSVNMVASDGVLFPETYFNAMADEAFPFVTDYELRENENGFKVLLKHESLRDFLEAVRLTSANLLCEWESVSLKRIPEKLLPLRYDQSWAYFVVSPKEGRMDAGLPPIKTLAFSAQRYQDELALWISEDTQKQLKDYFDRNSACFLVPWKVVFMLSTKGNNKFIELRIIPLASIPAAGTTDARHGNEAGATGTPSHARPRPPSLVRPLNTQNPRQPEQRQNSQPQRPRNRPNTPPNEVNPRYRNR